MVCQHEQECFVRYPNTGKCRFSVSRYLLNIAQGYKKQGAAKLGCVIWLLKCSAVLEEV